MTEHPRVLLKTVPSPLSDPDQLRQSALVRDLADSAAEHLVGIAFDVQFRPLDATFLAKGGPTRIDGVDMRAITRWLLAVEGMRGLLLLHNHPEGRAYPSTEDIDSTAHMAVLTDILGITLIDHCIVTRRYPPAHPQFLFSMQAHRKFATVLRPQVVWSGGYRQVARTLTPEPVTAPPHEGGGIA